tara:strand:+ start:782 stop:1018 length:237 start_codon:yes stop_codon:yes gene_type:complete
MVRVPFKKGNLKLNITYSDKRAKKDKYNREKGLRKLEKRIRTGKLTKGSINNREPPPLNPLPWRGYSKINVDTDFYVS